MKMMNEKRGRRQQGSERKKYLAICYCEAVVIINNRLKKKKCSYRYRNEMSEGTQKSLKTASDF